MDLCGPLHWLHMPLKFAHVRNVNLKWHCFHLLLSTLHTYTQDICARNWSCGIKLQYRSIGPEFNTHAIPAY